MSRQEAGPTPPDTDADDSPPTGSSRRHSALVAAGILLSRIFGFVRERAVSHFLGLSFAADALTVALRIPNLMQNLLGEGVLSASFIPVYARLLDEGREEEAGRVAGAVAGLLALVVGVASLLLVILADPLVSLITPGLSGARHDLAVSLMRITSPGIGLLVLSAWCLGVLNSHRRFFLSYVAPVLWNLAQIAAVVTVGVMLLENPGSPAGAGADILSRLAEAVALGTLVGGLLQFGIQLPVVRRLTGSVSWWPALGLPGVRRTLRAFGPVVAGRGAVQLLSFLNQVFASLLVAGAFAALFKAQMLYVLPISLFGMSVAAAELPDLSTARMEERAALQRRLNAGLERIAFWVVPTVVGYVLLGDVIVAALFQTGAFDRQDVVLVWLILAAFCVGLVATTASRLLQSALYGAGDTRGPATLGVIRVAGAAVLGLVLMLQLDRLVVSGGGISLMEGASLPALSPLPTDVRQAAEANHLGAVGLALGSGIFGWIEYRLLKELLLARSGVQVRVAGRALRRILASATVAALVALGTRPLVADLHPVLAAAVAVPLTAAAYLLTARRLGVAEATALGESVRHVLDRRAPDND